MDAKEVHQPEKVDISMGLRALEARALAAMSTVYQLQREAEDRERQAKVATTSLADLIALRVAKKKGKRVPGWYDEDTSDEESDEPEPDSDSDFDDGGVSNLSESVDSDAGDSQTDSSPAGKSDATDDSFFGVPTQKTGKTKYSISKYKIKPRAELESLDKTDLLDRFSELQKFASGNKSKLTKRQLVNCIVRLEDYLYDAKKKSGATITPQEQRDAEDDAETTVDVGHSSFSNNGLRTLPNGNKPTKRINGNSGIFNNIYTRLFPGATADTTSPTSITIPTPQCFTLPSDDTRNFSLKKWTLEDYQRETTGRLPFIDPEVKQVLEALRRKTLEEQEKHRKYAIGPEYNPDDLALITIPTLPSNGPRKVIHAGPQSPEYYHTYTTRLFASVEHWVRKYLVPDDLSPIDISAADVSPSVRSALRRMQYFNERDFIPVLPTARMPKGTLELMTEQCRAKRQSFFQYIIYSILNRDIWGNWLYGLDERVGDRVLEQAGLDRSQKNTPPGHAARGKWFLENVREKPTNMTTRTIDHRVQIATTLRQLFVPLLRFKDKSRNPTDRRMPTSAERELHMIISDAQALQYMFQSEKTGDVHLVLFDEVGTPFDGEWMVNAANREDMRRLKEAGVPGRSGELSGRDRIALSYRPALFIGTQTLIWEKIVVL